MEPPALVAELVDAQDLKSCLPKGEYGFDSRLGHKMRAEKQSEERVLRFLFLRCSYFPHAAIGQKIRPTAAKIEKASSRQI